MRCLISAVILFLACACGGPQPAAPAGVITVSPQENRTASPTRPVRLTQSYFKSRAAESRESLVLDPKSFQPIGSDSTSNGNGFITSITPIEAQTYTECRIRLKTTNAAQARLSWWGKGKAATVQENPGVLFAVSGDGAFHDYTIDLETEAAWSGSVHGFAISAHAEIELESASLAYISPKGPRRTTLDNVTMESLDLNQAEWLITVPQGGIFEAHAGFAACIERCGCCRFGRAGLDIHY